MTLVMTLRLVFLLILPLKSSEGNFASASGPSRSLSCKEFQHAAVLIRNTVYELTRIQSEVQGKKEAVINIVPADEWDDRFSPELLNRMQSKQVGTTSVEERHLPEIGKHSLYKHMR